MKTNAFFRSTTCSYVLALSAALTSGACASSPGPTDGTTSQDLSSKGTGGPAPTDGHDACVPNDAGARTCTGGRAGTPSPEGGCCSEWIPCETGLVCEPDGPVHPGSLGTCTAPRPACTGGGSAGTPSPEGGCCSEWIPCQPGLSCQPNGPVYPGSMGICAPPSATTCATVFCAAGTHCEETSGAPACVAN